MKFRVEIARKAAREIEEQYAWLANYSRTAAPSLEQNPGRYGLAPEAEDYEGLRELLHRKRQHVYRILFEVRADRVIILRVRHAAGDRLDRESP
jgi:plasmid stabilization system protein ParE